MLWGKNNREEKEIKAFTVRLNPDIQEKIKFLQQHKGLNKSNVIRCAICDLYNRETANQK